MTKVEIIQKALEDKKATNIEVLDVAEQTSLADYFVVASCQSTVQVRACVDEIEEKLEEAGFEINHKEGYRGGSWILVDCGDVIVHVMQHEMREFYAIERLWDDDGNVDESEEELILKEQIYKWRVTTLKLLKKYGRISGKKQVHSTLKQTAKSLNFIQ